MSYRENYQTVVDRAIAFWNAFSLEWILQIMSRLDPTRRAKANHNGNGTGPDTETGSVNDSDALPLHGGAADGLPVAALPASLVMRSLDMGFISRINL